MHADDAQDATAPERTHHLALTIVAVAVAIALLRYMHPVAIPLVLGILLFYALDPIVDRMAAWRIPRMIAAAVVLVSVTAGAATLTYALLDDALGVVEDLPAASEKLLAAVRDARNGAGPLDKVERAARELETAANEAMDTPAPRGVTKVQIQEPAFPATAYLWSGWWRLLALAGQTAIVLFLTYFLLLSDDAFKRKLVEAAGPAVAAKRVTLQMLDEIADQIERFLLVQALTSAIVGLSTWAALAWMGLEQAALWGVAAAVLNTIPYFGPLIVSIALFMIAFLQYETFGMAAAAAAVAFVITALEGMLLTPALMSRVSGINPVTVFAALLFWSWMWGLPGLLLAVPIMMTVKAVCDRVEDLRSIGRFLSA